jgi:hypothetical protein
MGPGGCQEPGRTSQAATDESRRIARAVAEAEALVRADQQGVKPQDLLALADRALRMAAGLREHLVAGSLLDAWAAADWLGDLAQEVKDALPVSSQDILAAVEGNTIPPFPKDLPGLTTRALGGFPGEEEPPGGAGGRGAQFVTPGTDAEERARSKDAGQ